MLEKKKNYLVNGNDVVLNIKKCVYPIMVHVRCHVFTSANCIVKERKRERDRER